MVAHVDPLGLAFLEPRAETFTACDTTDDYVSLDLRRRAIAIAARYTSVVETVRVTWPSTIDTLGPLGRSQPAWRGGRVVCGADALGNVTLQADLGADAVWFDSTTVQRHRKYAHHTLDQFIESLGREQASTFPGTGGQRETHQQRALGVPDDGGMVLRSEATYFWKY